MENLEFLLKGISTSVFQCGGIDSPLITKRRSRMCVGIRASHKSLLPNGIILGISSSGATYFMEPREAVELNNMEVRLSNSEKTEELAILSLLTSDIASSEREIRHLMERILQMDLASARGAYALWTDSICPVFCEAGEEIDSNEESFLVDIEGICHPLLLESFHRSASSPLFSGPEWSDRKDVSTPSCGLAEGANVVPVDIKIGHATKVVVISGPNTGGKTATMKSLGLASLMAKAGIFLPSKGTPRLPWFDQVLADIGDHQSLEHNLSTFSGHISRLCKILDVASPKSLVLIDEIGNGTDPSEGVALATSILQYLAGCVRLAVVTTHYADLSLLRAEDSRFENAAMEFCIQTLQPTYRVLWGSTGNSNALSIAKSIGIDQKVLDRAQEWVEKLIPDKQKERQGLLYQSLLKERNMLGAEAKKAEFVLMEVKKLYHEIHSEAKDLDKREAALKAMESQRVHQELELVKSQMDAVVRNFEKQLQNASPDEYNVLMRQSEAAIVSIADAYRLIGDTSSEDASYQGSNTPQIGDQVHVKGLGNKVATVVGALGDDGSILVQYGKIRVRVKRNEIKVIRNGEAIKSSSSVPSFTGQDQRRSRVRSSKEAQKDEGVAYSAVVQTSKNTIDLRGMRVEEASNHLLVAISACRSYGVLFIVHGVGTGALKECVLRILKDHTRVTRFEEESPTNDGCTVAHIK
uniref:MutS2 protein n=1 Tax=Anthurium amnicola TaxID=1678845 RepID=A0A1D1YBZ8_9ARAE